MASLGSRGLSFCRLVKLKTDLSVARQFPQARWSHKTTTGRSRWHVAAALAAATATGTVSFFAVQKKTVQASSGALPPRPVYTPSRRIVSDTDKTGLKLTLYQYQSCPFCCKVRAFLDYHGFSYNIIEVNPVWRTQVKWSKYKKVPILVLEGVGEDGYIPLVDSSVIVSFLSSYLQEPKQGLETLQSFYPSIEAKNNRGKIVRQFPNRYFIMYGEKKSNRTSASMLNERKWRQWVDSDLVHMLSPNVYHTPSEALQAFNYFSDAGDWKQIFSESERRMVIYVGATAMYFLGKVLKRRYKLKDDLRESLYDSCFEWTRALKKNNTKFMGGDEPDLSDLAVYGVLSSIEGCEAFQDVLRNTFIKTWFYDTKAAVNKHAGSAALATHQSGPPSSTILNVYKH